MILTTKMLCTKRACKGQRDLFHALTGGSIDITAEWCVEHADKFDWNWAAKNLLSAPALTEFERVCAPALTEFERVCAPALAEFERVRAPTLTEFERVRAPALAEFERVCDPAWAEFDRVRASAWAAAYNSMPNA